MVVVFLGKEVRNVLKIKVKKTWGEVENNLYSMLRNKMMSSLVKIISLDFHAFLMFLLN
jgi:hypothetical protein